MVDTCNVCVEKFTRIRKEVVCEQCNYSCCSNCTEKHFSTTTSEPHCMQCGILWDMEFLHKTHSVASQKRIRQVHKDNLFNQEKSHLPDTQQYIDLYREIPILKNEKQSIDDELSILQINSGPLYQLSNIERAFYNKQCGALKYESVVRNERIKQIKQVLFGEIDAIEENHHINPIITEKKVGYIKRCVHESCKGFVQKSNHKCGVCKTKICHHCLNELTEDDEEQHECSEDDVATATLLMKDSKPCPECGVPIHRIDGCSHMFCTQCKTPFDWKTMKIQRNGNSNPHYYEWLRTNTPSTVNTSSEEDTNNPNILRNRLLGSVMWKKWINTNPNENRIVELILINLDHMSQYFGNIQPMTSEEFTRKNRHLRVKYLVNDITEEKMKTDLMKQYKRNEFDKHLYQIGQAIENFRVEFPKKCLNKSSTDFNQLYNECFEFKDNLEKSYTKLKSIFNIQSQSTYLNFSFEFERVNRFVTSIQIT